MCVPMRPPTVNTAAQRSRNSIDRLLISDLARRSTANRGLEIGPRFRKVANHTRLERTPETTNGDDLARSPPSVVLFLGVLAGSRSGRSTARAGARARSRTEVRLQIRQHRVQLCTPVRPVVRAVGVEV